MYCVIMAGGKGTRFWPRSRAAIPKQLLQVWGSKTMLQESVERISPLVPAERVIVVAGREHADAVHQQLPGIPPGNILVEPIGRNTVPCICLAALWIQKKDPDAIMAVLAADHYIGDTGKLCRCLEAATEAAHQQNCLVTIGITPERPETGYGYIQYGAEIGQYEGMPAFQVKKFHEKPGREKAQEFLHKGTFLWNSGMFVWKASTILAEIKTFLPEIYNKLLPVQSALGTPDAQKAIDAAYAAIKGISIDYGVMEKSTKVVTLEGDFGWSDVGSWSAVYDISEKDPQGNVIQGNVIAIDAERNLIYASEKLTAVVGLKDIVVVETADALLVCSRDQAQDVKKVVELLEEKGMKKYL
jgi:mannose-1-phosphate guanylyltransferase